jgi:pyridoxal phosphate biosynthetic protein pdxA
LLHHSIRRDFRISNPRIALLALNPKAGDNGLLGSEEQEVIEPAIAALEKEDIQAFGPYAADKFFGGSDWEQFDGVLAMYYEQGLTPFRSLTVEGGVSYLAGLPLVRTAPETPANFSIAGKGVADAMPMRHAIFLAIDIFRHRKEYDEPMGNPLAKLYKERRDDSEKVRFAVPKRKEE